MKNKFLSVLVMVSAVTLFTGCSESGSSSGSFAEVDHSSALSTVVGKSSASAGKESKGSEIIQSDGSITGSSAIGSFSVQDSTGETWDNRYISTEAETLRGESVKATYYYNYGTDTDSRDYEFRIEYHDASDNSLLFVAEEVINYDLDAQGFPTDEDWTTTLKDAQGTTLESYSAEETITYPNGQANGDTVRIESTSTEVTDVYLGAFSSVMSAEIELFSNDPYLINYSQSGWQGVVRYYDDGQSDVYATLTFPDQLIDEEDFSIDFELSIELLSGTNVYEGTFEIDEEAEENDVICSDLWVKGTDQTDANRIAQICIDFGNGARISVKPYTDASAGTLGSELTFQDPDTVISN